MKEEQGRIPLRTILQNFLNHIESLETQRIEDSYEKEFQELKFFSEILKTSKQYSCSEGEKEVNKKKNRYKDILPFDNSRVILSEYAGVPGSDYINANYIKGASGSPAYIACQGPLPHTVNDFWRMVVECEVQVIVMACNEEEAGKHKCENYWVEREGEEKQFGMVAIRLVKASTVCPDFLVRTMRLKYTSSHSPHVSEERTVCQFHYSAWPDHGVPPLVRPLLDMVRLVRDTQASETLPVLVHCSAGCGRTGTICAIDYVWGLLRAGKLSKDFSLYKLVQDMRKQRIAMVQTKEQYVLVHQAVRELFREQLRMIDSHPYENIDANGMPLLKEEEEPMYSLPNIVHPIENSSEEKQDGKEKEIETKIPPLPQKRRGHFASSKQEKEVENLSEKQRSIVEQSSASGSHKPRIAKLKALFERSPVNRESRILLSKQRNCQQVTRSHSLGAVRDKNENKDKVTVKTDQNISTMVPSQSSVQVMKPCLPVKRSKSLKVLSSSQNFKFSLTSTPVVNISSEMSGTELGATSVVQTSSENVPIKKLHILSKVVSSSRNTEGGSSINNFSDGFTYSKQKHSSPMTDLDCIHYENAQEMSRRRRRRRSLESVNFEEVVISDNHKMPHLENVKLDEDACKVFQDCKDYLISCKSLQNLKPTKKDEANDNVTIEAKKKVNTIIPGLGIRERRNSFRQAVNTSREQKKKPFKDYEAIWPVGHIGETALNGNCAQICDTTGTPLKQMQGHPSNWFSTKSKITSDLQRKLPSNPQHKRWDDKFSDPEEIKYKTHSHLVPRNVRYQNLHERSQTVAFNPQTTIKDEKFKQLGESKSVFSVDSTKINFSHTIGSHREDLLMTEHNMNSPLRFSTSEARIGAVDYHTKQSARSKLLIQDSKPVMHDQIRMDPNCRYVNHSVDSDTTSHLQSWTEPLSRDKKVTLPSARSQKINPQFRSVDVRSPQRQVGICDSTDETLRNKPQIDSTTVSTNLPFNCKTLVPCHRNVPLTNSRVNSGPQSHCQTTQAVADGTYKSYVPPMFNPPKKPHTAQELSYGLVAGVQLRLGSQDDLALCPSSSGGPSAPPRVRRHASVVLLRRNLKDKGGTSQLEPSTSQAPLTVWNATSQDNGELPNVNNIKLHDKEGLESAWTEAPGIDIDTVAASINPNGIISQHSQLQPPSIVKKQHYF